MRALREALVEVGRALVYSGLALCAGFAVMLSSSFVGAIYFGLLTMLTIMIALVADLVLLPVLLRWYDSWRPRLEPSPIVHAPAPPARGTPREALAD